MQTNAKKAHEHVCALAALLVLLEVASEDATDEIGWAIAQGVRAARRECEAARGALDGEAG